MITFISQPMNGLSKNEILEKRNKVIQILNSEGYEVIDSFFGDKFSKDVPPEENVVQIPVWFLSESLKKMSYCDTVYFCEGWKSARGCKIEHEVAKQYGLNIKYEKE